MKIRKAGDWIIALSVVGCSAVLFGALAMALSGSFGGRFGRTLEADFEDITGLAVHSQVKFSGADAGVVTAVRILSPEERKTSADPRKAVRLTLSLRGSIPPLPAGIVASVSSDTLLSDKFVLLEGGDPSEPPLADGALVPTVSPTTFDTLVRNANALIVEIDGILGGGILKPGEGTFQELRGVLSRARTLLERTGGLIQNADSLVSELRPAAGDIRSAASGANSLIAETKEPLGETLARLDKAAATLDKLSQNADALISGNKPAAEAAIRDLRVAAADLKSTAENAKVATTFAKILARQLTQHPSQIIWGTARQPALPTEQEILSPQNR